MRKYCFFQCSWSTCLGNDANEHHFSRTETFFYRIRCSYLKCSYFQTPSSCPSGGSRILSMFEQSALIFCWIYYRGKCLKIIIKISYMCKAVAKFTLNTSQPTFLPAMLIPVLRFCIRIPT